MTKILVPVNPLRETDTVMAAAFAWARDLKAKLTFVTLNRKDEDSGIKELRRKGLRQMAAICRRKGIPAVFKVVEVEGGGEAIARTIARLARDFDLIVMGHFQYDRIYRFVHQSTAQDVMNIARTPILIVPQAG